MATIASGRVQPGGSGEMLAVDEPVRPRHAAMAIGANPCGAGLQPGVDRVRGVVAVRSHELLELPPHARRAVAAVRKILNWSDPPFVVPAPLLEAVTDMSEADLQNQLYRARSEFADRGA